AAVGHRHPAFVTNASAPSTCARNLHTTPRTNRAAWRQTQEALTMRTLALAIVATFSVVAHLHAQSPAGRWLGATPDGGSLGLDLTVTGNAVTGTLVVIRDGQALPVTVQDGRLTGAVLEF